MDKTDPNATGLSKKNLINSVKHSLKRLDTDYIDILYVHFYDYTINVKDLILSLDEIIKTGLKKKFKKKII
jgi:aryl-alcohol dehydrogenase-like predicted oxidoreductase